MRLSNAIGSKCDFRRIFTREACSKPVTNLTNIESDTSDTSKNVSPQYYCITQVKKYDRENYLAALCIKDVKLRRAVFALRALNVQLSLVRDSTTNSDRAKLRFHFWSKLVEEIIKRNNQLDLNLAKQDAYYSYSPLAKELLDLFIAIDIDDEVKGWLEDLIGSRVSSKILGYTPISSMEELELYCSKSNSSLYHLGWVFGQQLNNLFYSNYEIIPTVRKIASTLGIAQGLSNIIRGIPYNSTRNCCYIPKDVLAQHKLTSRDFVGKDINGRSISPAVRFLANRCQQLLDQAFLDHRYIPNYYRALFLPRVAIQANLNRLAKCDYNICDKSLSKKNELLPLSIWLASKYFRAPIL